MSDSAATDAEVIVTDFGSEPGFPGWSEGGLAEIEAAFAAESG